MAKHYDDNKKTQTLMSKVVQVLNAKYPTIEKMVLFGDYATGKQTEDSNYDVLVIMDISGRVNTVGGIMMVDLEDAGIAEDVHIHVRAKNMMSTSGSLQYEVDKGGVILYDGRG